MSLQYALNTEYTLSKALLWGNFEGHVLAAKESGNWKDRIIHALIATAEFLPVISQLASVIEMVVTDYFHNQSNSPPEKENLGSSIISQDILPDDASSKKTQISFHNAIKIDTNHGNPGVTQPKFLPPLEKDAQRRNTDICQLKDALTNPLPCARARPSFNFALNQKIENSLLFALQNRNLPNPCEGIQIIEGGNNYVFFLDDVPGFVFKPIFKPIGTTDEKRAARLEDANKYVALAEKAYQIVVKENLFLLYVPESVVIEINGNYFVVQEKVDLVSGKFKEVKGIYSHFWEDKDLENSMKTLFSQMLIFISKMGFKDVKYDNIPFTKDGKIALIDLDESSIIQGLTEGDCVISKSDGYYYRDGLFNYIPLQFIDEFLRIAKNELSEDIYVKLNEKIEKDIKKRAEIKKSRSKNYSQFVEKNKITDPTQKIDPNLSQIFPDHKKRQLAQFIVKNINKELSKSNNFSLRVGRIVELEFNVHHPLAEKTREIWGSIDHRCSKSKVTEVLQELKDKEFIYKFNINDLENYVKISC